jgi:hypothetical protein
MPLYIPKASEIQEDDIIGSPRHRNTLDKGLHTANRGHNTNTVIITMHMSHFTASPP